MNQKKKAAVLKAKKGLDGFFTRAEGKLLRRDAVQAAAALGLSARGPVSGEAPAAAPFHANALRGARALPPSRSAPLSSDKPRRSRGSY